MIRLNESDRQTVAGALDTLAHALADHGHEWTEGERAIYERACAVLGLEPCEFAEAEDDDADDAGEAWKGADQ